MSSQGERGKQGDHGQDGARGATGATGAVGPAVLSWRQTVSLFLFVVFCFTLLAYRTEHNASGVRGLAHKIDVNVYEQCVARQANVLRTNTLYTGLARIERHNPFVHQGTLAARTVQERIDLFNANMLVPPNCGDRP